MDLEKESLERDFLLNEEQRRAIKDQTDYVLSEKVRQAAVTKQESAKRQAVFNRVENLRELKMKLILEKQKVENQLNKKIKDRDELLKTLDEHGGVVDADKIDQLEQKIKQKEEEKKDEYFDQVSVIEQAVEDEEES